MKKTFAKIAMLLALILLCSAVCSTLAACTGGDSEETSTSSGSTSEGESDSLEESSSVDKDDSTERETAEGETSSVEETTEMVELPEAEIVLDCEYANTIKYAGSIANKVQSYYTDKNRLSYVIENTDMSLEYVLDQHSDKQVSALKNTSGGTYIENTMDVFVKMTDGKTYYAASSIETARANVYRLGYYYYDVHFLGQDFHSIDDVSARLDVALDYFNKSNDQVTNLKLRDGELMVQTSGTDPYIRTNKTFTYKAEDYNAISISIKTDAATKAQLFFNTTSASSDNEKNSFKFNLKNDGEYHTYTFIIPDLPNYADDVTGIRLDFEGAGHTVRHYINKVELLKVAPDSPEIVLDRIFHTYADKLHQELHFVAKEDTENIAELGIVTRIAADRVNAIVVKDGQGMHDSLEGVDWTQAEYAGFDIKDVGIFGYIMPSHAASGRMVIELVDDYYVITQSATPEDGELLAPVSNTGNDYRMGHRLYTDESHSFDQFISDAEFERNPTIYIKEGDGFISYDALDGAFEYSISGSSFNNPFFFEWNNHYGAEIMMRGDSVDRKIYVRTVTSAGGLENAVLMNSKDLVLPIPLEVSKNFTGDDKEPLLDCGDKSYGETLFPLYIAAKEKIELKVLNLYQNWGNFPIKQLSSIQYGSPYYHLSTGVTETTCIAPFSGYPHLCDFRSMSAPYWYEMDIDDNQPQHTHAGSQHFLQYTDSEGGFYATENVQNLIDSCGPVYADVTMSFVSHDGRIKVTYTHSEMPQTDEHRAYYEIEYEVLGDISFNNFKEDFSFYSAAAYTGHYRKMGYLGEDGQPVRVDAIRGEETVNIVLGKENPYVALYDLYATAGTWGTNNANLGFVVYDSDITIGGEKYDGNFALSCLNDIYSLSLNLEEVTLKAGDKISLDMIIVPWGSHESVDDSNMVEIRKNTCLEPLKVEVGYGEKIDSTFIPKVRSTDGKSVEFTLSGGANNASVRAYGFKMLTSPKVQELVDGEWVDYAVSSVDNPDKQGNRHYYDGYYTYYDNDGSFSYAFCVNMDGAESRTFRVTADKEFEPWPNIDKSDSNGPLNVYISADDLGAITAGGAYGIGKSEIIADENCVRFYGGTDKSEGYFKIFGNEDETVTGQYLAIKYRIPETNSKKTSIQVYISTVNKGANESDCITISKDALVNDGEWHVVIVDLSKENGNYKPNDHGEFVALYARLDVFNGGPFDEDFYIDYAYVGIADSLERICQLNMDEPDGYIISHSNISEVIDFKSGETSPYIPDSPYIDKESGYHSSLTPYVSSIDFINGKGNENGGGLNRGGNYKKGIDVITFDGATVGESYLAIAGWTMVYEGVDKYVWSADGGVTWNKAELYNLNMYATVGPSNAIIKAANGFFNIQDYDCYEYSAKSIYTGSLDKPAGISAKLTDYVGQTVDVIFAVIPENDRDSLCLIACIENVRVYASDEDAAAGEAG